MRIEAGRTRSLAGLDHAEPSRAEPSQGTVVCPPANPPFNGPRGGEGIGSSSPSPSPPPRVYTRAKRTVSRLHRVKAQLPRARARALLLVRRTTSILPLCILRSLGRSGNAEPRRDPRLAAPRLASPRFACARAFLPSVRVVRVFPFRSRGKTLQSLKDERRRKRRRWNCCYCCDIREEAFSLYLSLSLSFLRFRRGSEPCSRTKRGNLSRRVVEGKKRREGEGEEGEWKGRETAHIP